MKKQKVTRELTQHTAARKKYALSAAWLAAALWMVAIFCFSAQPGEVSQLQSDSVGYYILNAVDASFRGLLPAEQAARVESVQTLIRKGAHMTEYALLGALLWNALRRTRVLCAGGQNTAEVNAKDNGGSGRNARVGKAGATLPMAFVWRVSLAATLCGALYAATDEWHQSFVPGRSAQVTDVCIDTAGVLLGVLACIMVSGMLRRARERVKEAVPAKNQQNAEKSV